MAAQKLQQVAKKMKEIDFCMMVTHTGNNILQSRPMSNNGDVEYDGDSWFFTYDDTNKVKQITADPKVTLVMQGGDMSFIHVNGIASIIKDKALMKKHWQPDLKMWFKDGIDTPGITLLKVSAKSIKMWDKADEIEINISAKE